MAAVDQRQLRSRIYREVIKDLWIGTFHALFARLLRFDIDKFRDPEGLTWTRQFSIYDEGDTQSLVKEIVTQELGLDPKRFEPKKVRWAISNAKNQGWMPEQLEADASRSALLDRGTCRCQNGGTARRVRGTCRSRGL